MIGIGTIGRAAGSGGSTTPQNGQYIAFDMYDTFVYIPKGPNPYRNAFAQL